MQTPPQNQTRFGKYELLSRLAKGGMAETFRAQLTGAAGVTKQLVIKKVLPNLAEDEAFVTAFINEAKVSTRLSHGNIAQVFDFGQVDGNYFIAMELVEGRSLAQVLERAATRGFERLPEPIACFLAIEVLKGLHYAHTRRGDDEQPLNIVHRDVSPENILVSFEGQTKVVDFGVAKAAMSGRAETEPGMVKGKFLYLSPEQALAKPLDGRSDVYAVGIVLYRMLCGVLPFQGQSHVVMHRIALGEFKPADQANPELAGALVQVLEKAMATRAADRFDSALEMQDALASFLYRREPTFSSERVMEFMRWLFRAELERDGRPVTVSVRFETQLKQWNPPERSTTAMPRLAVETRPAHGAVTTPEEAAVLQTRPNQSSALRPWLRPAVGAAAVALLIVAVSAIYSSEDSTGPTEATPFRARVVEVPPLPKPRAAVAQVQPTPPPEDPSVRAVATADAAEKPPRDGRLIDLIERAKILTRSSQFPAARALLEECARISPKQPECHKLLGSTFARMGKPEQGAAEYRLFLRYAPPDHPDIPRIMEILEVFEHPR